MRALTNIEKMQKITMYDFSSSNSESLRAKHAKVLSENVRITNGVVKILTLYSQNK